MSAMSRLPPLPTRRTVYTREPGGRAPTMDTPPPNEFWLLDEHARVRGGCKSCAGRGHFVWYASGNIKLDCSVCEGTGEL